MSLTCRLIHADPERVFADLRDGWAYASWVVGTSRIRRVSEHWPQPGARLHHSFGLWPLVVDDHTDAVEWDPPRHATLRAHGGPLGTTLVRFDVRRRPGGCLVCLREDVLTGPALLLPAPLRDAMLRMRNRETLRRLGYLAEGRQAGRERARRAGA